MKKSCFWNILAGNPIESRKRAVETDIVKLYFNLLCTKKLSSKKIIFLTIVFFSISENVKGTILIFHI
jgi:hypothetical protein